MAKYGRGACPVCKRSIALTSYARDATVWRHDPPVGERDPLVSCNGSWKPHAGGPIGPAGTDAVQPALDGVDDGLFAVSEILPGDQAQPHAA